MNLPDIPNVTSSPASADGLSPLNLQVGPQTDPSGPHHAPASPSALLEHSSEIKTNATSGPRSSISSASADLTRCLGNRLQTQLAKVGSMEYRQTWKELVTPAGRRLLAHTASARPILDRDCSGWPTPQEDNANNAYGHKGTTFSDLPTTAQLAGWPTPVLGDAHLSSKPEAAMRRIEEGKLTVSRVAAIAGWPTPSTRDHKGGYQGGRMRNGAISTDTLDVVAQIAGQTTMSSPAPTEKRGGLNPALPRWLMGFPAEWDSCGATAMQSSHRLPRNSSKPS